MALTRLLGIQRNHTEKSIKLSLIVMVLVAILPLLVFGSGVAWLVVDQKKDAVTEELIATASALQVAVDRELRSQFRTMDVLASDYSLYSGNFTNFQKRAEQVLKVNTEWLIICIIDPRSHKIISGSPAVPSPQPISLSPQSVDKVVQTHKPSIVGTFRHNKITKDPIILLMAPVVRNDKVIYVLGVAMRPQSISNIFSEQKLEPAWTGAILDDQMVLAGRSRDSERYVGLRGTQSLVDHITASEKGMFTATNQEGESVYTVFRRSALTGWSVVIGVPSAELDVPIRTKLLQLSVAGCLLILFSLVLTAIVGRMTLRQRSSYEEALLESEERYSNVFHQAAVGVARVDVNGRFVEVNQKLSDILGYAGDELVKRTFQEITHPDDLPRDLDNVNRLFSGEINCYSVEKRYLHKSGRIVWGSLTLTLTRNGDGSPKYYIAVVEDIQKRKEIEEELHNSRIFQSGVIDQSPINMWVSDDKGTLIRSNQALRTHLKVSDDELIGKYNIFNDVQVEEQGYMHQVRNVFEKGTTERFTLFYDSSRNMDLKLKNSTKSVLEVTISPVINSEGKVTNAVIQHLDISALKEMEANLNESKRAAEAANYAKSQFLANMSHEIRTPMNGVIGVANLLSMTDLTDEQREYVEILNVSGKNLLSLINNILDLSKIEAGKIAIKMSEFSLYHCINDIVLTQKTAASQKGLSLEVYLSDDIPPLLIGDQLRIKQILLNLLVNALKFTSHGGITIETHVLEQLDNSVIVQISVSDTGIGISSEALESIFQPFVQEDGSISRQFGGTGLGLSISRRLVQLFAGTISVESTPGIGSCFKVNLPFRISNKVDSFESSPNALNYSDGPKLRVLFAEDSLVNTTVGSSLLKKLGHEVVTVENGRECITALEQVVFDLVLMDIQMPVMNGEDALRQIRRKEQSTGLRQPIIALTAHALRGEKERLLAEGFDGYVSKPLDLVELMSEIKYVLDNSAKTLKSAVDMVN